MNSFKCPECNLTNWATATACKRCKYSFQTVSAETQPMQESFSEHHFADADQNAQQNFQPPRFETPPDRSFNQSSGQNYQRQNYQRHEKPNYQYGKPANLKSGLAIASMVLGILGFVTSILLVGLLLAPIGLILGIVALVKANKKPHIYGGKGFAIAGVVVSGIVFLFVPIITAIAIPNLLAARRAANEGSAISNLRTIAGAEKTLMAVGNTNKCGDLQTLSSKQLIDSVLAAGEKNGYHFTIINLPIIGGGCEIHAVPMTVSTGTRSFYFSTEDGIIRAAAKNGKLADRNDLPLNISSSNSF